jgi:hypothetical protein
VGRVDQLAGSAIGSVLRCLGYASIKFVIESEK